MRSNKIHQLNTITAFERDIRLQLDYLRTAKLQKPLSGFLQKRTVFCGTGDSFVSALLAESFSDYGARALDPHDAAKNKKLLKTKRVYFVSISGNTKSNINAAKITKDSVAITKNTSSRLAKACKGIIHLDYEDSGVLTCGSIGFLASMLACISLVKKIRIKNAEKLFSMAKAQAGKITPQNKVYILGSQHTYPLAMYCTAKLYETLGADAHYERIEQFSHMGLFSARRGDTVIIFEEENKYTKRLVSNLKELGLRVHNPHIGSGKIDQLLFYTFISQFVALNAAKKRRISECHFVTSKKVRNASSQMIY